MISRKSELSNIVKHIDYSLKTFLLKVLQIITKKEKNPPAHAGDAGTIPGSGRFPGEGNGNPPVCLPGKSHGQRSLRHSPWGHKSQTT